MDFLHGTHRQSRVSEVVYVALNLGLATLLFLIVLEVQSPWLALALVIASKWRALAVRPRFWLANIVANMIDLTVGISVVMLMYAASGVIWLQVVLAVLHALWLVVLKPRSDRRSVAIQAGVGVFVGATALAMSSYRWDAALVVLPLWVLGYCAARHILGSYEEPLTRTYALITATIFAELGWVSYHWMFAYTISGLGAIKLAQLPLFLVLFGSVCERAYNSYYQHGVVRGADIVLPSTLAVGLVLTLLLLFNSLSATGLA